MKQNTFSIKNVYIDLQTEKEEKEILKGVGLTIKSGEVHAVMGPNGAGKSTLALGLMGHTNYKLRVEPFDSAPYRMVQGSAQGKNGELRINKDDLCSLLPEERAKKGLFVSFQQPIEITGVSVLAFLRTAYKELHPHEKIPLSEFKKTVLEALHAVGLSEEFMKRSVNEGFSGGERKRAEIAQMIVLKPKFAILDEIDSGLDIDSLKTVAKAIQAAVKKSNIGVLLITHYQRILHHIHPDAVHVLINGKIKKSGGIGLVKKIENEGYAAI